MQFDFCQTILKYQNSIMKRFAYPFVFILVIISALSFTKYNAVQKDISGAWRVEQNGIDNIIIYNHFTRAPTIKVKSLHCTVFLHKQCQFQ